MKCDPQAAGDELFSFLTWGMKKTQINLPPSPPTLSNCIKTWKRLKAVIAMLVPCRCFNDPFVSIRITFR